MRVKLQMVMCSDDGHEETVTDIVTLKKEFTTGQFLISKFRYGMR